MNCSNIQAGKCMLGVFWVVKSWTGGERGWKGKPMDKRGWASVLRDRLSGWEDFRHQWGLPCTVGEADWRVANDDSNSRSQQFSYAAPSVLILHLVVRTLLWAWLCDGANPLPWSWSPEAARVWFLSGPAEASRFWVPVSLGRQKVLFSVLCELDLYPLLASLKKKFFFPVEG